MSNVIDLLLNADIEQIERPSKEVEIKRLSNIFGEKFTVLCKALAYDKYSEIQENCIDITTKEPTEDMLEVAIASFKLALDPDADKKETESIMTEADTASAETCSECVCGEKGEEEVTNECGCGCCNVE